MNDTDWEAKYNALRESYDSLTEWADAINNLYLCHECQPKLERVGSEDEQDDE